MYTSSSFTLGDKSAFSEHKVPTKFLCVFSCDISLCFSSQEAAWTISNITAGQPHQIQCVVDAGLIPGVVDIMIKVN